MMPFLFRDFYTKFLKTKCIRMLISRKTAQNIILVISLSRSIYTLTYFTWHVDILTAAVIDDVVGLTLGFTFRLYVIT